MPYEGGLRRSSSAGQVRHGGVDARGDMRGGKTSATHLDARRHQREGRVALVAERAGMCEVRWRDVPARLEVWGGSTRVGRVGDAPTSPDAPSP